MPVEQQAEVLGWLLHGTLPYPKDMKNAAMATARNPRQLTQNSCFMNRALMWAYDAHRKYTITPTFALNPMPAWLIPTSRPAMARVFTTMSTHHQSRGRLTPSRQTWMNLGGRRDIRTSEASNARRPHCAHVVPGGRG